jgi:REP element-mobilizing transposase RayT
MQKYNPHIHHRKSIRLKGYDYSQAGAYFITICCHDRACLFGEILDHKMVLNEWGIIAQNEWFKTTEIRKNIELGDFIVMPNQIHGILIINEMGRGESHSPNNSNNIINGESHSPNNSNNIIKGECNSPLRRSPSNNIGAIVRGYKSSVTKQLNLLNIGCAVWQRNYYEHIIRNEQSYQTISNYILNNPAQWQGDKFYKKYNEK